MKAYLRGQIIAYTSSKRKKYIAKILYLENKIKELERQHVRSCDSIILQQLKSRQLEYNMINTPKTENAIKRIKHRNYEQGHKAGKLLAWQIKKEETNVAIYTFQKDDTFTSNPREINEAFLSYYQSLYITRIYFLDKLVLPTLSDDKKETLEGSITKEEVMKALTSLASGKSPGHDRFPNF